MAGEIGGTQFRFGAVWAASMAGALLLWVAVAALASRSERGHIASVDSAQRTITLEMLDTSGGGPRTFAISRNFGIQRFDQSLSLGDVRPGQWVEVSVRTTGRTVPTVTSIRIVREAHGSVSGPERGSAAQADPACEKARTALGSSRA